MAETSIPYKFYRDDASGNISVSPGTNTPYGQQEVDFGGALAGQLGTLQRVRPSTDPELTQFKDIQSRYQSGGLTSADYGTLSSNYWRQFTPEQIQSMAGGGQVASGMVSGPQTADNKAGVYTAGAQEQMQQLASDPNQMNIGTADKPMYVPKGSPGAQLAPSLGQNVIQDASGKTIPNPSFGAPPQVVQSKFQKGFEKANGDLGGQAPEGANGTSMVSDYVQPDTKNDLSSTFLQVDEFVGGLAKMVQDFYNPVNQRKSLTETYNQMLKDSGVQAIDMELVDMKKVIEGTEDDIRTEVMKSGGFATDSQVLALANARNKQLIKNYNYLLDTRNAKEKYLNTAMGLEQADRQAADQRFESMFNISMQLANYQEKMKTNAVAGIERMVGSIGWDGILEATQGDSYAQSLIEKTYGLPKGGLAQAANQAKLAREREQGQMQSTVDLGNRIAILDQSGNVIRYEQKGISPGSGSTGGGVLSSLPISVQTKLIGMAESFGSTDIVKKYNATVDGLNLVNGINTDTQNPSDHQTMVYAFAKSLDPESVVREGEYETIKKYAQSTLNKYNKEITNALNGTGFLSKEAIENIKTTMNNNYNSRKPAYDNLRKEKAKVIDNVAGKPVSNELLIDYSGGVTNPVSQVDNFVDTFVSGLVPTNTSSPISDWWSGFKGWFNK